MITDALLRLSGTNATPPVAEAITTTAFSGFGLDLRSSTNTSGGTSTTQIRDLGVGDDLYVTMTVGTTFISAGATTMQVDVVASDDLSGTNVIIVGTMGVIPKASLVAGANFVARINPRLANINPATGTLYRYLLVKYTITTGPMTAGAVFADIVTDIYDSTKFYGSGFVVS